MASKNSTKTGTLLEHVEELASRLRNSTIILLVFATVGLFYAALILYVGVS